LSGQRLTISDGPPYFGGHLLMEQDRLPSVDSRKTQLRITRFLVILVDRAHKNNHSSFMVTTEAPLLAPTSTPVSDAEALFKEAQRHRRNRRLKGSAILFIALLLVLLFGLTVFRSSGPSASPVPVTGPGFTKTVLKATKAAGGAAFTSVIRSPGAGCGSPTTTSDQVSMNRGSVNFAKQIVEYSTTSPGCPTASEPLTIQTPTATYRDVGSNVAPSVPTSSSRPWLQTPSSIPAGLFSVSSTMLTADIAALLSALPSPLASGHTALVDGETTTEYQGTTTLALLERDDPEFVSARGESLVPSASSIKVPVQFWVNKEDQLVRVSATEPYYFQRYPLRGRGGELSSGGAQVSTTSNAVPPVVATTPPRQLGVAQVTLTFTDFGPRVIALPSPLRTATDNR
jgi:hypothetical protein